MNKLVQSALPRCPNHACPNGLVQHCRMQLYLHIIDTQGMGHQGVPFWVSLVSTTEVYLGNVQFLQKS